VYPGPIGAILTPQLIGIDKAPTLPFASSLCGACYDACPVKIDIPSVLLHLRSRAVQAKASRREHLLMRSIAWFFRGRRRYELAQRLARIGQRPFVRGSAITQLPPPLAGWTKTRDLRGVAPESFRTWWKDRP
jgi:L-lactate dehydrogenase complex protein LldF